MYLLQLSSCTLPPQFAAVGPNSLPEDDHFLFVDDHWLTEDDQSEHLFQRVVLDIHSVSCL